MSDEPAELKRILTRIDGSYSKQVHLPMLKFLVQAVVPHEQLESCGGVPEVYKKIKQKCSDYRAAVALLRHVLRVTGFKTEKELKNLGVHCCEGFDLSRVAPLLPFYELLLLLAKRLFKNNTYLKFLEHIAQDKLSLPKLDLMSSPLAMLQSMICKGTIDPTDLNTLRREIIVPLEDAGLTDEARFMQRSVGWRTAKESPEDTSKVVAVAVYYNFEGHLELQTSSGTNIKKLSDRSMRTLKDVESYPLYMKINDSSLTTSLVVDNISAVRTLSPGHHQSRVSLCLTALVVFTLCLVAAFAVLVWYTKIPPPVDTQQVYHDIVYSPFPSINHWLFSGVEVQVNEDDKLHPHKVTLCQMECPLKTQTKAITFSGICRTSRTVNCFALFTDNISSTADAQYVSEYMLKNSSVTYTVTGESSKIQGPIHLCITTDKDTCQKIVNTNLSQVEMRQICFQVILFDKSYSYTQTFIAPDDGYYCAIWLLNGLDRSLNYTSISSIETYNLTDFNLCETLPQNSIVTHALSGPPTQNLCTVLKVESTLALFGSNITVVTSAVKTLTDTASIVLIAVDVCGIIFLLLVIAICVIIFFVCCKVRPLSTWVLSSDIQ